MDNLILGQKKYLIITFGCQMNEHDSEVMGGILEEMGCFPAATREEADIILINTCCVRETAENKVYGLLGELRRLKKDKPGLLIGVGGCMTQQETVAKRIKSRFPYVGLIFGTHNLPRLKELVQQSLASRKTLLELLPGMGIKPERLPRKSAAGIKAWVVITYGCNNYCTYCIVPYVRGPERSRLPRDILAEIKTLASRGIKEVTLLGQNVNSYGGDIPDGVDFTGLLEEINKLEGIERIRFMTSHPRDFYDRLIEAIPNCAKVCEHIHLPVQSGSDRILRLMGRGYNRDYYLALLKKIRENIPGVAVTTDIMVGFPGETREDFAQTMDLVDKARFDNAFTFIYNLRPGTPAALLPGQLEASVKKERIKALIEKQNNISREINENANGRVYQILVEDFNKDNPLLLSGRTRTNKLVNFDGPPELVGHLVDVEIIKGKLAHMAGRVIGNVVNLDA